MVNKDALFDELSKKFPVGNYTTFCDQMGVDYNEARSRLTRFKEDYNMALRDLLSQWDLKKGVTRKQLEDALEKAGVGGLCFVVKKHYEKDSTGQHSAAGQSLPSQSPEDSSGQHGAAGPSHPSSSPDDPSRQYGEAGQSQSSPSPRDPSRQYGEAGQSQSSPSPRDKWQDRTVRPARAGPDESDREMQYVMWESLLKGKALIIGNADFPQPEQQRKWAEMDIMHMTGLLKKLGYDFRNDKNIHRNLSKLEMIKAVQLFTEQLKGANPIPQSAVVYISSHGNEKGIAGKDGGILPIRDLLQLFSGVLLGKPKVLIIDACWGADETSRLPVSASSSSSGASTPTVLPENADIFMIHSTSYGKKTWSYTEREPGSWLVDELCEVVYNNDRDLEDLDTIMLRVTTGVHEIKSVGEDRKDVGTQSTTVFKQGVGRKLFFYPGYPPTNV